VLHVAHDFNGLAETTPRILAAVTAGVATYLGGRLLGAIPMLFLMSLVVFAIVLSRSTSSVQNSGS